MLIKKVTIHNYKSIKHQEFNLENLSIFVGKNNSGKSNLIDAFLTFFGHKEFLPDRDIYKDGLFSEKYFDTWIIIEFSGNTQDVIKIDKNDPKKNELSNISKEKVKLIKVFSGKKEINNVFISPEKGVCLIHNETATPIWDYLKLYPDIIYIPSSLDVLYDNIIKEKNNQENNVFNSLKHFSKVTENDKNLIINSTTKTVYEKIIYFLIVSLHSKNIISDLKKRRKNQAGNDYINDITPTFSYEQLTERLNSELNDWAVFVKISANSKDGSVIDDTNPPYFPVINFFDTNTHEEINSNSFGKGFQRFFLFLLMKIHSENIKNYNDLHKSPSYLKLIFFEEPESHMDLAQISKLNFYFKKFLSRSKFCNQIILTTHSTYFLSRQKNDFKGISQLHNYKGFTEIFQFKKINQIIEKATEINFNKYVLNYIKGIKDKTNEKKELIDYIENAKKWANRDTEKNKKIVDQEIYKLKNLFTCNDERTNLFFSNHVILCEGFTEKLLLDYCSSESKIPGWDFLWKYGVYVLSSDGSNNIPKYVSVLNELGISYTVMLDNDSNISIKTKKALRLLINFLKKQFPKIEIFEVEENIENYLFGETSEGKNKRNFDKPRLLINKIEEILKTDTSWSPSFLNNGENKAKQQKEKLLNKLYELERELFFKTANSLVKKSRSHISWYALESVLTKKGVEAYKLYKATEDGFKIKLDDNQNSTLIEEDQTHKGAPIFGWCKLLMKEKKLKLFDLYRSQGAISPFLSKTTLEKILSYGIYNLQQPDLILRLLISPISETFCKQCDRKVSIYPGELLSTICLNCLDYINFTNNR